MYFQLMARVRWWCFAISLSYGLTDISRATGGAATMLIHAPKIGGLGGNLTPKMASSVNEPPPIRHTAALLCVVCAIRREICRRVC